LTDPQNSMAKKSAAREPQNKDVQHQLFDIENSFAFKMVKLVNVMTREFQREFENELNVSLVEWRIIAVLHKNANLSAADIARRTGHNQMVISRAVKRLEKSRHIERKTNPVDGRRLVLKLTGSGIRVFEQISPLAIRWEKALADEMLPQDIIGISRLIDRAIENFDI